MLMEGLSKDSGSEGPGVQFHVPPLFFPPADRGSRSLADLNRTGRSDAHPGAAVSHGRQPRCRGMSVR